MMGSAIGTFRGEGWRSGASPSTGHALVCGSPRAPDAGWFSGRLVPAAGCAGAVLRVLLGFLHVARVRVAVLLAGELLDLLDDLVGDGAADEGRFDEGLCGGEVKGLAE